MAPAAEELFGELRQIQNRMTAALRSRALAARSRLNALKRHHAFRRPFQLIYDLTRQVDELGDRTHRSIRHRLELARHKTESFASPLESLSPLAVLGRGYSITERASDGRVIRAPAN